MKLENYHWHEALHTTHLIQMMIQRELIEHPVGTKKANKKAVKHLHKAMGQLEAFYQYCGEKGGELE